MTTGIYRITHRASGKHYVGLSVNIEKRWRSHMASTTRTHIANAIRKYGIEAFEFVIVEICAPHELAAAEIRWIAQLNSLRPAGYNGTTGGDTPKITDALRSQMAEITKALWVQPEFRTKVTEKIRASRHAAGFKERHSIAVRAAMARLQPQAAERAQKGLATRNAKNPEDIARSVAQWREATAALWADPERAAVVSAKRSAALKGLTRTLETRARMSAAKRAWWAARKQQAAA